MIIDRYNNAHELPAHVRLEDIFVQFRSGPKDQWWTVAAKMVMFAHTGHGQVIYHEEYFGPAHNREDVEVRFCILSPLPEPGEGGDEVIPPDSLDGLEALVDSAEETVYANANANAQ